MDNPKDTNLVLVQQTTVIGNPLIDEAVKFINEKKEALREAIAKPTYQTFIEIGNYILEKFFDNNIEVAVSKDQSKNTTFRALCDHQDIGFHFSTLNKMVHAAVQEKYFITQKEKLSKDTLDKLTYTHRVSLIRLPNEENKIALVNKIVKEGMTTRNLEELVTKERNKLIGSDRESTPRIFRHITELIEFIDYPDLSEAISESNLKKLKIEKLQQLRQETNILLNRLQEAERTYENLLNTIDRVESSKGQTKPRGRKPKTT